MENKPNLFLDLDGTITNSIKAYASVYNELYYFNDNYRYAKWEDNKKWDLSDICPITKNIVNDLFSSDLFFEYLEFEDNAREVIEKLCEKYNVCIVTIGVTQNISKKAIWIEKYLPFVKQCIFIKNKNVSMDKSKIQMYSENTKSIFIDDVASNLESSNANEKYCYGKVKEWNNQWNGERLSDWNSIAEKLL